MKIFRIYLFLFTLTLISCKEKPSSPDNLGCISTKNISLNWQNKIGKYLEPFIELNGNIILPATIDGATHVAKLNPQNGEIISSINRFVISRKHIFLSNQWMVTGDGSYDCYHFNQSILKRYKPDYTASKAGCIIKEKLYFSGRLTNQAKDPNDYDYHFIMWDFNTQDTTVLTYAATSKFYTFIPHFFIVDTRQPNPSSFYFVYGKDEFNAYSLTFAKFNTITNQIEDLFNFESRGEITDFIQKGNILSFLNYRKTAVINVNLDNDELISVKELMDEVHLLTNSQYAYSEKDGVFRFYDILSGERLWEQDYSDEKIQSNLVVSDNELYAIGFNKFFVLQKSDGCLVHKQVLDFIGDNTEEWLANDIILIKPHEVIARNKTTVFSIGVE